VGDYALKNNAVIKAADGKTIALWETWGLWDIQLLFPTQ
jgi:hypothetical protein